MKTFILPIAMLALLAACDSTDHSESQTAMAQNENPLELDLSKFSWTREPESCVIKGDTIEVVTKPKTDL